ncbi:MAG: hypothetical protein ACRC35_06940 [Angustibacter sp.]
MERTTAPDGASIGGLYAGHHDRVLTALVVGIGALAAAIRLVQLRAAGPSLAAGDEYVMTGRALSIADGDLPNAYDWPTGGPLTLALLARVLDLLPGFDLRDPTHLLLAGRAVSVTAGTALVVVCALLAGQLCRAGWPRRFAATVAGTAVAVGFVPVVSSRVAHPEIQQDALVAASLLLSLRYDRRRTWLLLLSSATLAGAAAGAKYVGGIALLPLLASVLTAGSPWRTRAGRAGVACGAAVVGFALAVPGTVVAFGRVWAGVREQVLHSAGGHLGFDTPGLALWHHLGSSLPASIGPLLTGLGLAGVLVAALRPHPDRARQERLVAFAAGCGLAVIGLSHLTFPRYALLPLPALVALGAALAARVLDASWARRATRLPVLAGVVVVCASLLLLVTDSLRLVRAADLPRTERAAADVVRQLPGQVVTEPLALPAAPLLPRVRRVANFGTTPADLPCRQCHVVLSSFVEERYRAEPERYRAAVAAYDRIRREGTVVATIAPTSAMDYRWEALPWHGIRRIPFDGDQPRVGPVVTVVRLP